MDIRKLNKACMICKVRHNYIPLDGKFQASFWFYPCKVCMKREMIFPLTEFRRCLNEERDEYIINNNL